MLISDYITPVMYVDPTGEISIDTLFDFLSVIWSVVELYNNPSWANVGWLALDILFAVIPFATGSSLIRNASKLDNVSNVSGFINKFDNMYDSFAIGNDMGRVTSMALDTGSLIYEGYKPMNALRALGKADDITNAMRYAGKLDNTRFIIDKVNAGYKIVNVGSDGRGFFNVMKSAYGMEMKIIYRLKYGNKLHSAWWIVNSGRRIIC